MHCNAGILAGGHLGPSPSSASLGGQRQPPCGVSSAFMCAARTTRGIWSFEVLAQVRHSPQTPSNIPRPRVYSLHHLHHWQRPGGKQQERLHDFTWGWCVGWGVKKCWCRTKARVPNYKKERVALIWFRSCVCFNDNFICIWWKVVTSV